MMETKLNKNKVLFAGLLPKLITANLLVALIMLHSGTVSGEQNVLTGYAIKAAYLYKFILFTQWSKTDYNKNKPDEKTVTIGILGKDPFDDYFAEVEGKTIKYVNKRLIIKRFGPYESKVDFKQCHLLFISRSEKDNLKKILASLKGKPVLTVSDINNFTNVGGMIYLLPAEETFRWEINRIPVNLAGLKLNPQVLQLAVRVIDEP